MALLFPATLPSVKERGGLFRELDVIERLQLSLPDNYTLFHSLPLHSVQEERDRFGEVDIVAVAPNGNVLLIEVKAGGLVLREGTLFKLYATREHDVARQSRMQHAGLISRLKQAGLRTYVTTCLVLPDYTLTDDALVSYPRERIVDAAGYAQLGTSVKVFLSDGAGCSELDRLHHFLRNEFHAHPDITVMRGQLQHAVQQLSDGLATWVPRITSPSGMMRIEATAGSGKTQLALALIVEAVTQGKTIAYICFNRPLADHVRRLASPKALVANFHEMCVEQFRRGGGEPDFSSSSGFDAAVAAYAAKQSQCVADLDILVIDEGQDFAPEWVEMLCARIKSDGQFYLMEDDDQRLYERPAFDLTDAVNITCRDNYRSPRAVCDFCNILRLVTPPIRSKNPYRGNPPGFYVYASAQQLLAQTALAMADLQARGFALSDIAIVVCKGRDKSVLLQSESIGTVTTRRFTGKFTQDGEPIWTDGAVLVESVYRFKGQSAPAIILAEFDVAELSSKEKRKLFVGITRAQMAVEIVLSSAAEAALTHILTSDQ